MFEAVLKNVRLRDRDPLCHIGIHDGKIAEITEQNIAGEQEWNAEGDLIFPPFVEMHTHLDTALTAGEPTFNQSGTLYEAIGIWQERKQQLNVEDVSRRATKALRLLVQHGVLFVRAAVDISDPDLTALKALLKVREELCDLVDLQIIAFPQNGLISCPKNQERIIQAMEAGADAVSAVPHLETTRENGVTSLEYCFSVAKKYHKFVHVFCDEVDDEHSRFLEVVADLTIQNKMEGLVTASHATALGYYSDAYAQKVMQLVKTAGVTIVACPLINSAMQGRFDAYPKGRGITRLKDLHAAGVNVCIAHDDIQTPFYPLGNGNILQAAHMGLHLAQMTGEKELESIVKMITNNGAKGFLTEEQYGIEVGKPASFVTLPAESIPDLMRTMPACRYVFRKGKLVVSTAPQVTEWHSDQTVEI